MDSLIQKSLEKLKAISENEQNSLADQTEKNEKLEQQELQLILSDKLGIYMKYNQGILQTNAELDALVPEVKDPKKMKK